MIINGDFRDKPAKKFGGQICESPPPISDFRIFQPTYYWVPKFKFEILIMSEITPYKTFLAQFLNIWQVNCWLRLDTDILMGIQSNKKNKLIMLCSISKMKPLWIEINFRSVTCDGLKFSWILVPTIWYRWHLCKSSYFSLNFNLL